MAKIVTTLAAALMISTAAHAEPLDAKKLGTFCEHLGNTWQGFKCAWNAAGSTTSLNNAKRLEIEAEETADPNKAQKLKNKAAYERAEAERYADEYRRKYAPK
ncbi:MAG TPA: hypothetical protein VMT30_02710 [Candidatus Saccharimonadia bacterium]|nr:hypothetical protein [Candidatus Saccharimonadia bacterium]